MLLKNGSTGNYVMYLQYGLHIMCCPPGSFDSKFGSGTEMLLEVSGQKRSYPRWHCWRWYMERTGKRH